MVKLEGPGRETVEEKSRWKVVEEVESERCCGNEKVGRSQK